MDDAARAYVDGLDPAGRGLFDRLDALIMAKHPDATVRFAYTMPTYDVGERRLPDEHRRDLVRAVLGRRSSHPAVQHSSPPSATPTLTQSR